MVKFGRVLRAGGFGSVSWWALKTGMTGSDVMQFRGAVSVAVEAIWDARWHCLGTLEAVLGHADSFALCCFMEKMHVPVCTLLLSFCPWAQAFEMVRAPDLGGPGTPKILSRSLRGGLRPGRI